MARSIATIKTSIINTLITLAAAIGITVDPTKWSATSMQNLTALVVATAHNAIENEFDAHVAEVSGIIAGQAPHTLLWYVNKAKAYQYGDPLIPDTDQYAAINAAHLVVNYAAATEVNNGLRVKVATLSGGVLAPLSGPQLAGLIAYLKLVRDACVRLQVTSNVPDRFAANLNIYYDALVLDGTGARLDGTSATPVQDAVTAFLDSLPFNGLFVLNYFINAIAAVPGVVICSPVSVQATYGAIPLTPVTLEYLPDAGYMTCNIANDLILTFIAHGPI